MTVQTNIKPVKTTLKRPTREQLVARYDADQTAFIKAHPLRSKLLRYILTSFMALDADQQAELNNNTGRVTPETGNPLKPYVARRATGTRYDVQQAKFIRAHPLRLRLPRYILTAFMALDADQQAELINKGDRVMLQETGDPLRPYGTRIGIGARYDVDQVEFLRAHPLHSRLMRFILTAFMGLDADQQAELISNGDRVTTSLAKLGANL